MATVTNNVTRFDAVESGSSVTSVGSGPGAASDQGSFVQGTGSWSRRQSNRTDHGMYVDRGATVDLSAANMHACIWHQHLNGGRAIVSDIRILIGQAGAQDQHTFSNSDYPANGGFFPIWFDVSRTPENTTGGGANEAACDIMGVQCDIGAATGQTANIYLDACQYTTTGLALTGTNGVWDDFVSFENNVTTGKWGVVVEQAAGIAVYARLTLGTASSLVFDDSEFSLTFPDQALVSSTFMGVTCDLQNASTNIDLASGTIQSGNVSGATNRPDFVVTGTSGSLDTDALSLLGMRTVDLTSVVNYVGGTIDAVNLTQSSADINGGCIIRPRTASGVAMCDDPTFGTTTGINNVNVVQAGSGHAFEITGDVTLTNITFSGFGANTTNDAAFFVNVGSGTVTINVVGGDSPTFRSAGATVVINNAVTVLVDGVAEGTAVKVTANETVGTITSGDVLGEGLADSNGEFSFTINYETAFDPSGLDVLITARNQGLPTAAIADDGGVFTDETTEANSGTDSDMTIFPASAVTNDAYYFGHPEQFAALKIFINQGLAGGASTIFWEYWNGSGWSALSNLSDGTVGWANVGLSRVTWDISTGPGGWATTTINSQGPYYYVRTRIGVISSPAQNPLARWVTLDTTRYLPIPPQGVLQRTITSSGLTATLTQAVDTISTF